MSEQSEAWDRWYQDGIGQRESISGVGSTLKSTVAVRKALPGLIGRHKIKSIIDVPCGDWNWMQHLCLDGVDYVGYDVVSEQIEANRKAFPWYHFEVLDLINDILIAQADLVICRDFLFHIPNEDVHSALINLKASGRLLLTTTFPSTKKNVDVRIRKTPPWRAINLCIEPFNLPEPIEVIYEGNSSACRGRIMGLFDCKDIK